MDKFTWLTKVCKRKTYTLWALMMRVISGRFKGKKLLPVKNLKIRPTLDRSKEMIFNTLTSILFKKKLAFENLTVLDTFCGTGALGIEAISRGAKKAFFIDCSTDALDLVKRNINFLEIDIYSKFLNCELPELNFKNLNANLFFMDPPYDFDNYNEVFSSLAKNNLIAHDALAVIELSKKKSFKINNYSLIKKKIISNSCFLFLEKT